jgi:hypothetical protein
MRVTLRVNSLNQLRIAATPEQVNGHSGSGGGFYRLEARKRFRRLTGLMSADLVDQRYRGSLAGRAKAFGCFERLTRSQE